MNGALFLAAGLGLLAFALNRQNVTAAAAGGGILALCLYCYGVSRVLPLCGFVFLVAALSRGSGSRKVSLWLLASSCLGFAAMAAAFVGTIIGNSDLLYSNSGIDTHDFQVAWHQDAPAALAGLVQPAANLLDTVLAAPRMSGGYVAVRVWQGGLLDALTGILVLLGLFYAVARCRRPGNILIICAIAVVFGVGATVQSYWLDTYRLGGAVPALFLAAAFVIEGGIAVMSRAAGGNPRLANWILVGVCVVTTSTNVHRVATQLNDCRAMAYSYQALSRDSDEGILMADKVNALGSTYATFIVSPNFQSWLYYWLYRVPPVQYYPRPGPPNDPLTGASCPRPPAPRRPRRGPPTSGLPPLVAGRRRSPISCPTGIAHFSCRSCSGCTLRASWSHGRIRSAPRSPSRPTL